MVSVNSGGTVPVVVSNSSSVRAVDWDLLVVLAESVAVSIRVGEETTLEHLIVGWLDTWNQVGWSKGGLLNLSVVVLWVSIEGHLTNSVERVVLMRPNLGDVEDIESVVFSVLLRHQLNVPSPRWEVTLGNGVEEIRGGEVLILKSHLVLLLSGEVLDSLVSLEVVLNKVNLALLVNPLESVGRVTIHEAVSVRSASVREKDGNLVKGLWSMLPEVEDHVWIGQVGSGVSLLTVEEVWELDWIVNKEHWGVVANHVVIAFLGVKLNSKATRITDSIGSASLTGNS